jgi:hypothetical protein
MAADECLHRATGYDGPLCSEYEGAGDVMVGTGRSIAYLRATFDDARRGPS